MNPFYFRMTTPGVLFAATILGGCQPSLGNSSEGDTQGTTTGGPDSTGESGEADSTTTEPTSGLSESEGEGTGDGSTTSLDVCGDGIIDPSEACDDGLQNGEYNKCSANCGGLGPHCGDGAPQAHEGCDDGNSDNADACTNTCAVARCGDSIVQTQNEVCDDGANNDNDDGCTDLCRPPECGDGFVQQTGGEECDDGNASPEDGCENDCKATARLVFLTSAVYSGSLGGVAGGDALCQISAVSAGRPGIFRAWLGSSEVSPSKTFAKSSHPYKLANGEIVAYDFMDLTDGSLKNPIDHDEFGEKVDKGIAWTGVSPSGSSSGGSCENWTVADQKFAGWRGLSWLSNDDWTAYNFISCDSLAHIYCFQQ